MNTLVSSFFIETSSYLQVKRASILSRTSSKFGQIGPRIAELAALERPEKSPLTYNGRNLVNTLAPSFLIRSSSFLQVRRTCMKAWMSSNFGQIPPPTLELSALVRLKIDVYCCEHSSAYILDQIFFILSGNNDCLTIWTEFEFEADWTKGYGVSCP